VHPAKAHDLKASASDEDAWTRIKASYPTCSPHLNLKNAALSPQPRIVEEAVFKSQLFGPQA
jgi:hypothetical protein